MKKKETLFDILLKVSELRMDIETAERSAGMESVFYGLNKLT